MRFLSVSQCKLHLAFLKDTAGFFSRATFMVQLDLECCKILALIAIILLSSHRDNHRHPTHMPPGGRCCPHLRITVSSHIAGSSLERDNQYNRRRNCGGLPCCRNTPGQLSPRKRSQAASPQPGQVLGLLPPRRGLA